MFLKDKIKQSFSNSEIFNIFKKSKKILLFLIEEKILFIDDSIVKIMTNYSYDKVKYPHYFFPEIKSLIDDELNQKISKEIPENFEEKRKIGQSDDHICELIRKDLIDDFIKANCELNSKINISIFESNSFLLEKFSDFTKITLIDYAAFFGSIKIFNYLYQSNVEIKPSLLIYSIHSNNLQLIHFLWQNIEFDPKKKKKNIFGEYESQENIYEKSLRESIKCHHNNITNYIINNWNLENTSFQLVHYSIQFCNFAFFPKKFSQNNAFYFSVKYNYLNLIQLLLETGKINVNAKTVKKHFYL